MLTGRQWTRQLSLQDTEARVVLLQTAVVTEEPAGRILLAAQQTGRLVGDVSDDFQSIVEQFSFHFLVAALEANFVLTPTVRAVV